MASEGSPLATRPPWHIVVPVLIYLALVVAGVNQSSIGIMHEHADTLHSPMLLQPQNGRTDEFLTSTPIQTGAAVTGRVDLTNPLSAPQAFLNQLPAGPVSALVLPDGTAMLLGPHVPPEMLVALRWWLPFLLLALGAPALFRLLTGSRAIGWFAVVLVVLSPLSAWWSFGTVQLVALTVSGGASLVLGARAAEEGRLLPASGWCLLCAVLLARTPLTYQPWALVVVPAVLLAVVLAAVSDSERRRRTLLVIALTGALTLALFAGVLLENRASIDATLGTVYPGQRLASGSANPFQNLFGATSLGVLLLRPVVHGTNASELSSGYTVAFLWVAVLVLQGLSFRSRGHRLAVMTLATFSVFWMVWSTVDLGSWAAHVPLVSLVPSFRSTSALGLLAVLLLCLVLPAAPKRGSRAFALAAGIATAAFAGLAGLLVRERNIPSMSVMGVVLSTLLLAVTVFWCTRTPRDPRPYVMAGVLAFLLAGLVNPVLVGLGDLHHSPPARQMLAAGSTARQSGGVWASDSLPVDALMLATGVPSLSGRQLAGPNPTAWHALDPDPRVETIWNRGAALVRFRWTDSAGLRLSSPRADEIFVDTSPCTLADREPRLTHVVSSRPMAGSCLRDDGTFDWSGGTRHVYRVVR